MGAACVRIVREPESMKEMKNRLVRCRGLACGALALLVLASACSRQKPAPQTRDANVLFITLDTTRADHLSCYAAESAAALEGSRTAASAPSRATNGRYAKTSHLDALAARGVRFAHATAQVPLTLPSHACMFTGTYPEVHQLRDMGGFTLDPKHLTLAHMARNAGFTTAAFVGSKA
ncbi:MAG: sulfatase-like hydrolase/transferase, partial [Acidobacteriia bacterium]|nr:sulfatase-like hydrolase/transferase [Terriglobia bacterium]